MQTSLIKPESKDVTGTNGEKGVIGIAFLVWLFGGGLALAVAVFVILKIL